MEIIGKKFNNLLVKELYKVEKQKRHIRKYYRCLCDCGKETIVEYYHIISGHTKSCGCYNSKKFLERFTKHGKRRTRIYRIWQAMKSRCYNPKVINYKYYGGKGITVCDEWKNDFVPFYNWAMANGYQENLTIDRINGNKNYEPSNCRWITQQEQVLNREILRKVKRR